MCHPNPCLHAGLCMQVNDALGFLCNCSEGFAGDHCQGTQAQERYLYSSFQRVGYQLKDVQRVKTGRGWAWSKERGQGFYIYPADSVGSHEHFIVSEYLDTQCTFFNVPYLIVDVDSCHPNPCKNSARCLHTADGFVCDCSFGFKGTHCQGRSRLLN